MELYSNQYEHLFLYGKVTSEKVLEIIKKISHLNHKIDNANSDSNDQVFVKFKQIILHINSQGGDGFAGITLTNIIEKSKIPIIVLIEGICSSAATFVAVMANTRLMFKNSLMLIHQYSEEFQGTFKREELEYKQKEGNKLFNIIQKIYTNNTSLTKQKLDFILNHDLYLTASECKKYKMIDRIIDTGKIQNQKKQKTIYIYNQRIEDEKEDPYLKCFPIIKKMQKYISTTNLILRISESSYFQSVLDVLPIINLVTLARDTITISVEGPICQYSLLYAVVAKKRVIYKYAYVMIDFVHDYKQQSKLDDTVNNNKNIQAIVLNILTQYTKLPKKILNTIFTQRYLFSSEECIKYKMFDKIKSIPY